MLECLCSLCKYLQEDSPKVFRADSLSISESKEPAISESETLPLGRDEQHRLESVHRKDTSRVAVCVIVLAFMVLYSLQYYL
jgi:hypothetical protein